MVDEPLIPFDFDPGPAEYEAEHLEYGNDEAGKYVKWPLTGVRILVLDHANYPDLTKLEELNGGMFKNWDLFGYTVSDYHEFFCGILPTHAGYRLGSVEVTFGTTTPLAVFLYDNFHGDHYFDEWENLSSARIIGCPREHAEALFINAALQYQNQFDVLPEPMRMRVPEELEVGEHGTRVQRFGPAIIDQDPLRFHYHGLAQLDNAAACIYFYRVLEYYAFFQQPA